MSNQHMSQIPPMSNTNSNITPTMTAAAGAPVFHSTLLQVGGGGVGNPSNANGTAGTSAAAAAAVDASITTTTATTTTSSSKSTTTSTGASNNRKKTVTIKKATGATTATKAKAPKKPSAPRVKKTNSTHNTSGGGGGMINNTSTATASAGTSGKKTTLGSGSSGTTTTGAFATTTTNNNQHNIHAMIHADATIARLDIAKQRSIMNQKKSDPLWYRIEDIALHHNTTYPSTTIPNNVLPEQITIVDRALSHAGGYDRSDVTPQAMVCLLEQARRIAHELIVDASDYAIAAGRMELTVPDLILAQELRSDLSSSSNVTTQLPKLNLTAQQMNRVPLPPIPMQCYTGIVLPPKSHQLTARTFDVVTASMVTQKMIQSIPRSPAEIKNSHPVTAKQQPSSSSKSKTTTTATGGYGAARGQRQIPISLKNNIPTTTTTNATTTTSSLIPTEPSGGIASSSTAASSTPNDTTTNATTSTTAAPMDGITITTTTPATTTSLGTLQ